jgi:hypothetical protein
VFGDETELLKSLLDGMSDHDVEDTVRAMNQAPPEKPAGRRRRRSSRPASRTPRRLVEPKGEPA